MSVNILRFLNHPAASRLETGKYVCKFSRASNIRRTLLQLLLIFCATMVANPLISDESSAWKVSGKLYGKPDKSDRADTKQSKKSKDVSGIACAADAGFPRICLVADDESQGVQIVILRDGELRAGSFIRLIDAVHGGKPLELDAEGVAFADGAFYVIGSHGRPRHEEGSDSAAKIEARAEATRNLFRIRIDPGTVDVKSGLLAETPQISRTQVLSQIIRQMPELKSSYHKPLEDGGLTIEGVAVRDGRLHAGLRSPLLDDVSAAIVSIPLKGLFDGQAGSGTLSKVRLGSDSRGQARGVRDLAALPDGLLILAGPKLDPENDAVEAGDYAVFSWDGADAAQKRFDLSPHGAAVKPEGLLPVDRTSGSLRALIFFDGPDEGAPRPIEIPLR